VRWFQTILERFQSLLNTPREELGRWSGMVHTQVRLWQHCMRRLRQRRAMAMSAELSFRTIFALVPAMVLAVLVLRSLGVTDQGKRDLRDLLEQAGLTQIQLSRAEDSPDPSPTSATAPATETSPTNAVPETQPATTPAEKVLARSVADELLDLVNEVEGKLRVATVGPIGVLVLVWSALSLLSTIESSLNRVFEAPRSRRLWRRVLLYWSVVTLMPLLLTVAVFVGKKATAAVEGIPVVGHLVSAGSWLIPVLLGILLLAMVYRLMPNTFVSMRTALGGAVLAVPIWMLAKWGFGMYVTRVAAHSVYGAMGLLPLFLLWVNLSWAVFLFGAEIAATAANLERMESAELAERMRLGAWERLAVAVGVADHYQAGRGPALSTDLSDSTHLPAVAVQRLIDELLHADLVVPTESDGPPAYVLIRPAGSVGVLEAMGIAADDMHAGQSQRYGPRIEAALRQVHATAHEALGKTTLADLLESTDSSTRSDAQ